MKALKVVYCVVFFALIAAPLLYFTSLKEDWTKIYGWESYPPVASLTYTNYTSRAFQTSFTEDFSKRFFLRKTLLRTSYQLREWMNFGTFHYGYACSILDGRDGVLFERPYTSFHLTIDNPLPKERFEPVLETVSEMDAFCKTNGIAFIFFPQADKPQLYPEYLPKWFDWFWEYANRDDVQAELVAWFKERGILAMDGNRYMLDLKPTFEKWVYPPGGTHFNAYGCGLLYEGFLKEFVDTGILKMRANRFVRAELAKPQWYADDDISELLNIWDNPHLRTNIHYAPVFDSTNEVMNAGSMLTVGDCYRNQIRTIFQNAKFFEPSKIMSAPRGTEQTPDSYRKLAGDLKIVMLVFQSFNTGKMDLRNDELKAIFKAIRTAVREAKGPKGPFDGGAEIALPDDPGPVASYAAAELRDYVKRVTGAELAVVTNRPVARGVRFAFVEDKALGEDGFRLAEKDGVLTISGSKKRGVLYGAYDVLERFAGVRWYSADTERVPKRETIEVPKGFSLESVPDFLMRSVHWWDYVKDGDFAARRRNNANSPLKAHHGGLPYRFGKDVWACHTLGKLVPASEFFATHPEYFGEIDGRRGASNQLCLTNPDVLKIVVRRIKDRIRADPGARFYGVSQDDHQNYCRCANCAAVDAEEGSHAGCVVRFVNAVAAEVEKEFPGAVIETLAYQYSRFPTKKTRLRHNVVPCICTIECGFGPDPIVAGTTDANRKFVELLRGWKEQTDELYVWDYTTNFRDYCHIFPNLNVLQANIRFFRDNHVRYLFEQGDSLGKHAFLAELKGYVMSKWMWDADLPQDELVRDFTDGYYGAGGVWVRQFLKELDAYLADYCRKHPGFAASIYEAVEGGVYDEAFLLRADGLWRKAEAAAAGDPVAVRNVRAGRLAMAYDLFFCKPTEARAVELDALSKEHDAKRWCEVPQRTQQRALKIATYLPGEKPWMLPGWEMTWNDDFDDPVSIAGRSWRLESAYKEGPDPRICLTNGCLSVGAVPAGKGQVALRTETRLTFMYGRIDVRAKLPLGKGLKAKVWTLGAGVRSQQWPWCGEIDIVRTDGSDARTFAGGAVWSDRKSKMRDGQRDDFGTQALSDGFHVYSIEWDKERIVWFVDGKAYHELKLSETDPNVRDWPPFNQYHFLLLGLEADEGADLGQRLLVDWVRIYERK